MADKRRPAKRNSTRRAPVIKHKPGLADGLMKELAPFLAEDGIDLEAGVPDTAVFQAALDRAVERYNRMLFTPVGEARAEAVATLCNVVDFIERDSMREAAELLDRVPSDPSEAQPAAVSHCVGLALGLLDEWLGAATSSAPPEVSYVMGLPDREGYGGEAAARLLVLACQGRAFSSLRQLVVDSGGHELLFAASLAVTSVVEGWSMVEDKTMFEIASQHIR